MGTVYAISGAGDFLLEGDGDFVILSAVETVVRELPWRPEQPVGQTLSWSTEIQKARDGSERRRSLSDRPRMSLRHSYLLDEDQQRQYRAMLKSDTDQPWKVPLWHEPVVTTGDAVAGGNTVAGDFSASDLQVGQLVYIEAFGGTELAHGEFGVVAALAGALLTISGTWGDDYLAGAEVFPAVYAQVRPGAGWSRRKATIASLSLDLMVTQIWPTGGTGAAVATYQGEPLLDREPVVRGDGVAENADRQVKLYDDGHLIAAETGQSTADLTRSHSFSIEGHAELQWWEKFLDTVRGRQRRFYASTWRHDLTLDIDSGLGGANHLVIVPNPDFDTRWFAHGQVDVQLETTQGILRRRVTGVTDNGTTQTLALDTSLPGGSLDISKVSFLELCRLASDDATFTHESERSTVVIGLRTLPPETDGALSTWSDYDKSIQDAAPIDLFEFTGPSASYTYRYTNYGRTVSEGGNDYAALAGGVEYVGDISEQDLDTDDLEIDLPVSAQLIQDYIREPNRGISVVITRVHGVGGSARVIFRGTMASISTDGDRATVLVSPGLGDPIRKVVPSLRYSPNCQNRLGDGVCGINLELAAFKFAVTASVVSGVNVTVSAHGQVDGFFDGGKLVDTTGETRRIVKQVGTALQLSYPLRDLEASDSVTIYAGCTKVVEAACFTKFANVDQHFFGMPYAPQKDVIRRGMSSLGKDL